MQTQSTENMPKLTAKIKERKSEWKKARYRKIYLTRSTVLAIQISNLFKAFTWFKYDILNTKLF